MKLLGQHGKSLMAVERFMGIHVTLLQTVIYFRNGS